MRSKICLFSILAATALGLVQSRASKTITDTGSAGEMLPAVECDPTAQVVCAQINSITYYGRYVKSK